MLNRARGACATNVQRAIENLYLGLHAAFSVSSVKQVLNSPIGWSLRVIT
jgi:hypothetical protein